MIEIETFNQINTKIIDDSLKLSVTAVFDKIVEDMQNAGILFTQDTNLNSLTNGSIFIVFDKNELKYFKTKIMGVDEFPNILNWNDFHNNGLFLIFEKTIKSHILLIVDKEIVTYFNEKLEPHRKLKC